MGLFSFVGWGNGKGRPQKGPDEFDRLMGGMPVDVQSSWLRRVIWDPDTLIMTVEFLDGFQGVYGEVTPAMVRYFWAAPSKGKWVWDNILVRGAGNQGKHRVPYLKGPQQRRKKR